MVQTAILRFLLTGILSLLLVFGSINSATGDWGAPGSNAPQQQPHPGQQPYPGAQANQPTQPGNAAGTTTQGFRDVFGRFSVTLPAGTVPMGATYNFNVPSSMCQVSIMSMHQEQMFQMQQQNFSNMMRQMGATIDADRPTDVNGRQARFIAVTMRDQNSGMATHAMNVFISGPGLWIQVMGPEQNMQQIAQMYNAVMSGLQI